MREKQARRGRHPREALNARQVKTTKGNGHTQRMADGHGLYLLIAPHGSKSWVLRVVVADKRRDIGLGGTTDVSLAEAREEARRLRKIVRAGGDPLAARRQERRVVPTFRTAAEAVHTSLVPSFKNVKHGKQWLASLAPMLDAFGDTTVDQVTTDDVMVALSPRWLARPETSRRVLQRVRAIFEWCKAKSFRTGDNPTRGITKVLPKHRASARHHPALPHEHVPAFIKAVRSATAAPSVRLAFEFTILCAARTNETLLATWPEIDLDSKTWTVPGARMKAGKEHRIPLSARCIEILTLAKELPNEGSYVFPGRSATKPLSSMALLMLLRRLKRSDITTHGFRSTFRDWAAECTSHPRQVCEAALAHRIKDKAEAAYHRTDLFNRRRALMDDWESFVTGKAANSGSD